jgi:hypothetical protein
MSKVDQILKSRAKTHGDFRDNSNYTLWFTEVMRTARFDGSDPVADLTSDQKLALEMICHKMGRILSGDSNNPEHWDDIAGYATLVSKILSGTYNAKNPNSR